VTTFAHVNIAAQNWRALANFYIDVFGCEPAGPERDLSAPWLGEAIGVPGARLKGQHLRLPGHGPEGPTLEIFQYEAMEPRPDMHANTPGLTHLCFRMDDVAACAERFIQRGGSPVGPLTVSEVAGVGTLTFQYMRDPEGNIVEIQNWS
jgi:predicted enzyme related to lactoylglutathione lyase